MAVIANLTEPVTINTFEGLPPLPVGILADRVPIGALEQGLGPPYMISGRFPTPPTAFAFLTGVDALLEDPIVIEGISNILAGAVAPEAGYLEPTTGQIWPRIG